MSGEGEGVPFPINNRNMETTEEEEAWQWHSHSPKLNKKPKISSSSSSATPPISSSSATLPIPTANSQFFRTQLCRRFREGVCAFGSKCNYAHGLAQLRRHHQEATVTFQPKHCRMFFQNKRCSYGHTCRFLHLISRHPQQFNNATFDPPNTNNTLMLNLNNANPFPSISHGQPAVGKLDGYSSAEYRVTQTSAATNASTSKVATSSLHKNEPYDVVKRIFKTNELQKISGIYADWI